MNYDKDMGVCGPSPKRAAASGNQSSPVPVQGEENPLSYFSENVDEWGAAQWFDRLARAIRDQDRAVLALHRAGPHDKAEADEKVDMYRNIAASSAMRLVRGFEQSVRAALSSPLQEREGYVLVPVEPTDAIKDVLRRQWRLSGDLREGEEMRFDDQWGHLLSAAALSAKPAHEEWQDGKAGQEVEPPAGLNLDTKFWFWVPDVFSAEGFTNFGSWFERPWRRSFKYMPAVLPAPPQGEPTPEEMNPGGAWKAEGGQYSRYRKGP